MKRNRRLREGTVTGVETAEGNRRVEIAANATSVPAAELDKLVTPRFTEFNFLPINNVINILRRSLIIFRNHLFVMVNVIRWKLILMS